MDTGTTTMEIVPTPLAPPIIVTGKIIQIAAWQNTLIALTDLGDVWALRGLGNRTPGSDPHALKWRLLPLDVDTDPYAAPAW